MKPQKEKKEGKKTGYQQNNDIKCTSHPFPAYNFLFDSFLKLNLLKTELVYDFVRLKWNHIQVLF